MDENLEQKIIENRKELKKEIKPSTIKMYISNIKKLSKLMNDGEEKGGIDWLKNIDKVKDKLMEKKENGKGLHYSSIRNYMNSAIIYLYAMNNKGSTDDLIEKYSEYRDELNKQYEEEASAGTWSEKQGKNVITMEELHKVITDIGNELKAMKLKDLEKDVAEFEPKLALDGGLDGLSEIRKVIKKSSVLIKKNGKFILEIGFDQKNKVINLLKKEGFYINSTQKDLSNYDRCIISTKI